MPLPTSLQNQIASTLLNTKSLPVSQHWLQTYCNSINPSSNAVPLQALVHTALYRILHSDIQDTLSIDRTLPTDVFNPAIKERVIAGVAIPVQVVDIDDIGSSAWNQIEAIERVERGEAVRGREIIRTVNMDGPNGLEEGGNNNNNNNRNNGNGSTISSSTGPYRLILQDSVGTRVVGVELKSIDGIALGKLSIGAKIILRNVTVARGIILLVPDSVTVLGGKIESLDRDWRESRKNRLEQRLAQAERPQAQVNGQIRID